MLAAEGGWVVCGDTLGVESMRMGCVRGHAGHRKHADAIVACADARWLGV